MSVNMVVGIVLATGHITIFLAAYEKGQLLSIFPSPTILI